MTVKCIVLSVILAVKDTDYHLNYSASAHTVVKVQHLETSKWMPCKTHESSEH